MKNTATAGAIEIPVRAMVVPKAKARIAFMDNLRYLMVVLVLLYHSVAAYAVLASYWAVRDNTTFSIDIVRQLLDVFMMPILYFAAGYFGIMSLEKKGPLEFVEDKVRRLLVPWALAVLVILPLMLYGQPTQTVHPFWTYWLYYLGSFEIRLRFTEAVAGPAMQAVYWFISLLFAFFLALAIGYALVRRWRSMPILPAARRHPSGRSANSTLALVGLLTSVAYFALLLLVPDSSWLMLHIPLEFQVTRLVPYAGYFAFGVYAYLQGWFSDGKPIEHWGWWGTVSVVLGVLYLIVGQPIFADTTGMASFGIAHLMLYALLRSFLLLSLLVVLGSFGVRYWNRASRLDAQLAGASYNMYLVHLFPIIGFQEMMREWTGGPVAVKAGIVFLGTLAVSYAISRWVLARHSRALAAVIMALFVFCLIMRP